jgi:hypothetical protein
VDVLRVKNGWAWVETRPQSRDGANHYEPVSALLRERDGSWSIIDIPCTDEGEPECVAELELFRHHVLTCPSSTLVGYVEDGMFHQYRATLRGAGHEQV